MATKVVSTLVKSVENPLFVGQRQTRAGNFKQSMVTSMFVNRDRGKSLENPNGKSERNSSSIESAIHFS